MKERRWEIYSLSDPRTSEVRYVGVTFRGKARFREHLSRAVHGGKTHRDCWIRSLIAAGLEPIHGTLERGHGEDWPEREQFWIEVHRPTLTNHTDGGEGAPGYVPTPELRRKWPEMRTGVPYASGRRSAMLGRKHTPEAIEKIRRAGTGREMPPAMKAKVSAARKGKPLSPEHVEKLVAAKLGKRHTEDHNRKIADSTKNRQPVMCVETGQAFASIAELARILDVTKASVSQAIRKGCRCRGNHYRRA